MPNKPTTVREEFKKKFEGYWRGEAISDEICFWWLSKFDSHNKDLVSKIEGLRLEIDPLSVNKRGHHTNGAHRKIRYNRALDDIIKLINQDK